MGNCPGRRAARPSSAGLALSFASIAPMPRVGQVVALSTGMPIEVRLAGSPDPLSDPAFASELSERYLIFDAYVAGARRVELHPLVLPLEMHRSAARAAESVVATIGRVTERAHVDPAERARYGLSQDSARLAAASWQAGDHAALMRVDLLLSEDGEWRACEINADRPGGHNESVGLPRLARAAGFHDGADPTHMLESLADRLTSLAELPGEPPGV